MEQFKPDTGWEAGRYDVRDTIATARAAGSHGKIIPALVALITRWGEIEGDRRAAQDAVDDANALVTWLDELLDEAVNRVLARLLSACDNDRTLALFMAFFPEMPSEVTKLTLAPEVERVAEWRNVRRRIEVPESVGEALDEVQAIEDRGRAALQSRKDALTAQADVSARQQTWRDEANAVRRNTETTLDQYANSRKLARDYSARFFPKPARVVKKAAPQQQPATTPMAARPSQLPPH